MFGVADDGALTIALLTAANGPSLTADRIARRMRIRRGLVGRALRRPSGVGLIALVLRPTQD